MLTVTSNIAQLKKEMKTLAGSDMNFVVAKSLTNLAQKSQNFIKVHIRKDFVNRSKRFQNSIKIKPARKNEHVSEVYTLAPYSERQELGGTRRAISGELAVPTYDSLTSLKTRRRRKNVSELLNTNTPRGRRAFIMNLRGGRRAVVRRSTKERSPIEVLYVFEKTAKYEKRLRMEAITNKTVDQFARKIFYDNLGSVIKQKQTLRIV